MASSSKQLDPYQISPEALEEQRRQLRCINRRCSYGDTLINAVEIVCTYYDVDYKPGKEVCMTCFTKCLKHYKYLEMKWKEGKCIMDNSFPSFDSYLVIDSSEEEEEEEEDDEEEVEEPKPSTSRVGLPPDQDVKNAIDSAVIHYFDKNKYLFEQQVKLCDEFLDKGINECLVDADKIDKLAADLEDQMASLRNEIYNPYEPIRTNIESVDINELEENIKEKRKKVETPQQKVETPQQKVEIPQQKVETPQQKIEILQQKVETPQQKVETPQQKVETPQQKIEILQQKVETPQQKIDIPQQKVEMPQQKIEIPQEKIEVPQEKINKLIEEVKTSKEAKRLKLDKSDKEDIITIDRTVCVVPANIPQEGFLDYPSIEISQTVYGMKLTLTDPWYRGIVKRVPAEGFVHVLFQSNGKLLATNEVAYSTLNKVRFPVGCRVIAKFTDPNSESVDEFYAGIVAEPPKMLNKFRYLIFFDVGFVQYRQHQDIRLIACRTSVNDVWKEVPENTKEFIKSYLEKYPERQMVKLNNQHSVRAEHNLLWQTAKVVEVDASLVKLYFTDFKHSEWIYRGSSRLYNIFEKQSKSEKGIRLRQSGLAYLKKPFVEFTSVEEEPSRLLAKGVARKSTSKNSTTVSEGTQKCNKNKANVSMVTEIILPKSVPDPIKYRKHKCSHSCVAWTLYNYGRTRTISMLTIPLHFGFVRYLTQFNKSQKCIMYRSPCGIVIRNMKQMLEYLVVTKSTMTIDQFDFNSWVKPFAEYKVMKGVQFLKDISQGKEFRGIPCVNTINNTLPPKMDYMTTRRAMPGVNINVESEFLCGCDCTDNCQDKSKCACWQLTIDGQKILPNLYKDPNIGYNYRRLPERVLTGIYECNKTCKCSSSCLNRVVQNPLSQKLQLFMTEKKGWGVRCLNDIPQGSFICIYVGYLLTETDANEGGKNYGDEYLAELDYIEVVEKIKEDYESDIPSSDHEIETETNQSESSDENYPCTSDGRRSELTINLRKRKKPNIKKDGKHVQVLPKLNAIKNNPEPPKSMREYFGDNESVYIMDAKTSGNIGRYLNHSCSPNTFVQNVFVDTHDLRFPWVSFFALHYIQAGTELTWDYSYDIGSVPGKKMKCHCESNYCRGRLL